MKEEKNEQVEQTEQKETIEEKTLSCVAVKAFKKFIIYHTFLKQAHVQ